MKKTLKNLSMIFAMLFTLAACAPAAPKTNASVPESKPAPQTTVAAETPKSNATVYPLTFTNPDGKTVTIEKEPQSIVSLSPTFTEVIFALGKGGNLKGRTDYCDYPADTAKIPSVGSMSKPSIEKITELKPDLVVVSFLKDEVVKKIEETGAKVIQIPAGDSIKGSYENMRKIAQVLNANDEAEKIIKGIEDKVTEVKSKVEKEKPVTAYYVAGFGETGDYTAGDKTFINEVISAAGGDNVAKDAEGWKYTSEKLMEKDPEVVIIGSMAKLADQFKTTEPYKNLSAVKNNKVLEVEDSLFTREGPRLGEAVEMLAKLLHPEAMK